MKKDIKRNDLLRDIYLGIMRLLYYSSFVGLPLSRPRPPHDKAKIVRCTKKLFWSVFDPASITVSDVYSTTDVGYVRKGVYAIRCQIYGAFLTFMIEKNGCVLQCKSAEDENIYKVNCMSKRKYENVICPSACEVTFTRSMHTKLYGELFDFYAIIIVELAKRLYAMLNVYQKRFGGMPKPRNPQMMTFSVGGQNELRA